MSAEKTIRKISVKTGGLKGLKIEGTHEVFKDNKMVTDGFVMDKKHPIHQTLEDKISELRIHVLDICGLITPTTTKEEKKSLIGGCNITSFEFDLGLDGYFVIKAESRVFQTKFQVIKTPRTDSSDGYEYTDIVFDTIKEILEEVDLYAKGLKNLSNDEIVLMYLRHGKGVKVDMEGYGKMSDEEKATFHQDALGKLGYLTNVIYESEISETGEEDIIDTEGRMNTQSALETNVINFEPSSMTTNEVAEAKG